MKITKAKFKLIFAVATLFVATLFCGISALVPVNVSATSGNYNNYPANTKVGYFAEYLGTVGRQKPEVGNEGYASVFPTYGETLYGEGTSDEKKALWRENSMLLSEGLKNATNCYYDGMDGEGNLYLKGEQIGRKLYRHEASEDMYYGNVSDGEEAVVKRISYRSRTNGNHITGLYAPAGEILTLTMSSADLEACGGLTVFVGQPFSDGSANIINNAKAYNRMPCIVNAMQLTENTATREVAEDGTVTFYFGSFLGGPVYLIPVNGGNTFTVTISGGVRYSHFILGYTTQSEFEENAKSSAPYFDLEVWDRGVRHSGPQKYAEGYTYSQLYDVALFWEKVASLANQFPSRINPACGIDFVYDPFVTSELVPQNTLNCPDSWLADALDCESIVKDGCNSVLGKYSSRFVSGWGFTKDSVSGDAVTLLSYSLYTQVSSKRNVSSESEGLDGIIGNSSASLALRQLKGERENNLAVHATIIHSFGQDAFIKAVKINENYSQSTDRWFRCLTEATRHDMSYYFTELCNIEISNDTLSWAKEKKYPMFVPAACIYQTGAGYEYDGARVYFRTVQPYEIDFGTPFEIDFDKVLELPYGFSYKIKSISFPENGRIEKLDSHTCTYTPKSTASTSGEIFIRLGIQRDDKSFEVEDKVLILEFKNEKAVSGAFVGGHVYKDLINAEEIDGISGFTRYSLDGILAGSAGVTPKQALSTFGHVYEGGQGSALEFTFYGTQFALYSAFSEGYGEFEIYIDGGNTPVERVNLGEKTETAGLSYLSQNLKAGRHTVKITGASGTFNIDSISLRLRTDPSTIASVPDLTPDEGSAGEPFRKPADHVNGNETDGGENNVGDNYTGLIVGLSVGGVVLVSAGVVIFIILKKKRTQQ